MEQDSDVQREALEGDTYLPRRYLHGPIAHYYGDLVRRIFLGIAVVLLIAAPFLGDAAFTLLPFEIIGALVLIIPQVPKRVKEWAYVGFAIDFVSAFISLWVVTGFGVMLILPLVFFALLIASYISYHKVHSSPAVV